MAIASLAMLVAPGAAGAATVVNGDFERGDLSGWTPYDVGTGSWFAYTGTTPPLNAGPGPVEPPPGGSFAAIAEQLGSGVHMLYQDIVLEPGNAQQLTMLLYYDSATLHTPNPNTLERTVQNQQYRVDLMRPTAPIESVDPADVLLPIFATQTGDPDERAPFPQTIDLAPFAGQTVRLRLAEVNTNGPMRAGADSVAILGEPPSAPAAIAGPPAPAVAPSNAIVIGKLVRNLKQGTAKLTVTLPGAGTLKATDARAKKPKLLKQSSLQAARSGAVKLALKPTGAGRAILDNAGKLPLRIALGFTPSGGSAGKVVVRKALKLRLW